MEKKEQSDQNPETELRNQEEKSESTENKVEENVENQEQSKSPQISENEKTDIVEMIQGTTDERVKPSISDEKPEVKEEASSDASEEDMREINDAEKEDIILLLHEDTGHEHDDPYANINFDELNKQELVEIIEDVVQEKDISLIKAQVAKINAAFYKKNKEEIEDEREKFIADGGKKEEFSHSTDPLENRFAQALSIYRHNKARFSQDLEKQKQVNLKLKQDLLEELKDLVGSEETLKKTYDEFKIIQDKWKEIGMVPASELRNLWQSYHFLVEKFFDKVRINRELRDLDLKKNLEAKIELCEKAEELLVEKSILKSFKMLQHYHDKWREIGPVPTDVKEDIWERFKGITEKINQRRKEYYKEVQVQQQANYEAKIALCEKAKELLDQPVDTLKGWQSSTDKINELFKLWKTIGRAPKAKNDEIWATFKGYLDSFFNAKREYLNELKDQQLNNYNLKLELITKAESFKDSTDWNHATRELISLQKEWKKIGPVPRKYSDKIWKKFRAICDEFFNRKAEHFKSVHDVEEDNLKKKNDLIKEIAGFKVSKVKETNLSALKDFQKRWIEIGFVPFKEKDKVQNSYRKVIDELISKMDVKKTELSSKDFEDKVEMMKTAPDAGKKLSKERAFISGRIRKMQEDLAVWENNIGFFASSKQSDKLKKEFEQKIQKAKDEIEAMKAKLRMLQ